MATEYIDWPDDLAPNGGSFRQKLNQARFTSPFTQQVQILNRPGSKFLAEWTFLLTKQKAHRLDALLLESEGGSIPYLVWDFRNNDPAGSDKDAVEWYSEVSGKSTTSLTVSGANSWLLWYTNTYSPSAPYDFSDATTYTDGTGHVTSSACETPKIPALDPLGRLNHLYIGSTRFYACGFEPGQTIANDNDPIIINGTTYYADGNQVASTLDGSLWFDIKSPGLVTPILTDDEGADWSTTVSTTKKGFWRSYHGNNTVDFFDWAPNQTVFYAGDALGRVNSSTGDPEYYMLIKNVVTDSEGNASDIKVHKVTTENWHEEPVTTKVPILMHLVSADENDNSTQLPYIANYTVRLQEWLP